MTAMPVPAERVWNPDDLLLTESIREVFDALSEEGAKRFALELMTSLMEAKEKADLSPVNSVITAWYRTMLFVEEPGAREIYERAGDSQAEALTPAEAVQRVREMRSALQDQGRG